MKTYNAIDMKGRLYDFSLEHKETEKGEAIAGDIILEVDAEGTTVKIPFYSRPVFSSGKPNKTYGVLEDIMEGNILTVVNAGEDADWFGISGSIDSSYFMAKGNKAEVARSQKMRGAFINSNPKKEYKNRWKLDFLITSIQDIEADPQKQTDRFLKVGGYYVDSYNSRLAEVEFQARAEGAINFFSTLPISPETPYYVDTWGEIKKVTRIVERQNAFGESESDEYETTSWVIVGVNVNPYSYGTDISEADYATYKGELEAHKESLIKEATDSVGEEEIGF